MNELETLQKELKEKLEGIEQQSQDNAEDVTTVKLALEKSATKEDLEAIKNTIEDLSKSINKSETFNEVAKTKKEAIKNAVVKFFESNNLIDGNGNIKSLKDLSTDEIKKLKFNVANKADIAINITATGATVPNFPSDDANVDTNYLYETATELGLATPLRKTNSILNRILATRPTPILIGEALKRTIISDGTGKPIKVSELAKKPNMTVSISKEKSESEKIAAAAVISEEALNRIDIIVNEILRAMEELTDEELEAEFYADIDGYGVPYAHNPALVVPTPTMLDAIFAVAVSMKMAKYKPTDVFLSSVDLFKLFGSKAQDGHYNLANGQSIQLLNGGTQLSFAGMTLNIVEVEDVNILAPGNFKVLDMNKIDFGLSSGYNIRFSDQLFFLQNAYVWLVEKAFASLLPSTYAGYAVVEATFADVIEDITEPQV